LEHGKRGKKVSNHFIKKHDVLIAGRYSGDIKVDLVDCESIKAMLESIGKGEAI